MQIMLHHIYRSNIGVLGHGQHIFQRYSSFKSKTKDGAPLLTSNVISRYIHQPQDETRSLLWPLLLSFAQSTIRYKSSATDRPRCSHPGCKALAFSRGLCYTHAYPCKIDDCDKQAQVGGYCKAHAKEHDPDSYHSLLPRPKRCKIDGCNNGARSGTGGYCLQHTKEHDQEAYQDYRQRYNKRRRVRDRDRYNNDVNYKMAKILRTRMSFELSRVGTSYKGKLELIGCSVDQLRQYFEYNHFAEKGNEWMSWENYGGGRCHVNRSWEVDHIMPVSSFDLTDPEEVKKCFRWSNLQPLEWQENAGKKDSIPKDIEWCIVKERWTWSRASGKTNYELPLIEKDEDEAV